MNPELERKLREVIGMAVGQASMCWQHPELAGPFQADAALIISEQLFQDVTALLPPPPKADA